MRRARLGNLGDATSSNTPSASADKHRDLIDEPQRGETRLGDQRADALAARRSSPRTRVSVMPPKRVNISSSRNCE